jgi:hypothetical protein
MGLNMCRVFLNWAPKIKKIQEILEMGKEILGAFLDGTTHAAGSCLAVFLLKEISVPIHPESGLRTC